MLKVKGQIDVSKGFHDYMKRKFNLNGRFSVGSEVLDYFRFKTQRFFNKNDYNLINKTSFQLRIANPKKIKYFDYITRYKKKHFIEREIYLMPKIIFKFNVLNLKYNYSFTF